MTAPLFRTTLAAGLLGIAAWHGALAADFKLGIASPRGALETMTRWSPLATYLSAETGKSFEIVPLPPGKIDDAIMGGQVDFALTNPASTVSIMEKSGGKPLATMSSKGVHQFAGVIIAKSGSGINKGEDLKGKKVMAFQFKESAAAYIFQTYHLSQKGIDVNKDFAQFIEGKKQDDIVLAVANGLMDAGFIRSDILESMAKEGKVKMDDFIIVDKVKDSFPYVHSTELYPEWFLVAGPKVDAGVSGKFKDAALKLKAGDATTKEIKIDGFVEPQSLDTLKKALKALKLPPYAN